MSEKRDNQRDKILVWLQMRGKKGILNTELNDICFRYGARIHELRKAGYPIETHKLKRGFYRFVLTPTEPIKYDPSAIDCLRDATRFSQAVQERLFA